MNNPQNGKIVLQGKWQMRRSDQNDWQDASVPGTVHTDLLRHDLIPDPFVGLHERDVQWVDKHDWIYRLQFDLARKIRPDERVEMVFPGLDTYAEASLNGTAVLNADNMFRTYRVDVGPLLRPRANELFILFKSPIRIGQEMHAAYGIDLPAALDQSERGGIGNDKLSVFTRKSPYHYGWDWGPRLVTSGIFRPIHLEIFDFCRISRIKLVTESIGPQGARLAAELHVEAIRGGEVDLAWNEATTRLRLNRQVTLQPGKNVITWQTTLENPSLWWCHTHGTPHLYDFHFNISHEGHTITGTKVTAGIRTIELVRQKDDRGCTFFFRLNGRDIFAKGANYVPSDSFLTRVSREKYRRTIELCVDANINMLRVWGGGFYEEDAFYDLCDHHGILIWHDFMFACSQYPDTEEFFANVAAEVRDNVARLANHPSIALWCGNNEIDGAWGDEAAGSGWGWRKKFDAATVERLMQGYRHLFHQLLPKIIREMDERPYWPSSPSADFDARADLGAGSGDIHYWGVWHENHPFASFNDHVGRFMSEYGFQSMPDPLTVEEFTAGDERRLNAEVIVQRQRCPGGTEKIVNYMKAELGTARDFAAFIPLSQYLQALALKTAIEAHRRAMPYCMGTLYWQLNDCWPTLSWSTLDYNLRLKAAHYAVKRAFAPTILSLTLDGDATIVVHAITDLPEEREAVLRLQLIDIDGTLLWRAGLNVAIRPLASREVWRRDLADIVRNHPREKMVLLAELTSPGGDPLASGSLLFVKPARLARPTSKPRINLVIPGREPIYEVSDDAYHFGVWLTIGIDGTFGDNYFELLPGKPKFVGFKPAQKNALSTHSQPSARVVSLLSLLQEGDDEASSAP